MTIYAKVVYWHDSLKVEEDLEMTEEWVANSHTHKMEDFLKQRQDMVTDINYLDIPRKNGFY